MSLQLFQVAPEIGEQLFIAAVHSDRAAEIFLNISVTVGWGIQMIAAERIDRNLKAKYQLGLEAMLAAGQEGIAVFERPQGWRVVPPDLAQT